MTPLNPNDPSHARGGGAGTTLVIVLIAGCLGSGLMYWVGGKLRQRERAGWNLVPIVVAAVDIDANGVITMEEISQRSIPEQFAIEDFVRPDSASYVINQRTRAALQSGDPLRWSDMTDPKRDTLAFFAKEDLIATTYLQQSHFELRVVDQKEVTASWITEAELISVVDKQLTVPLAKGDPLLWAHVGGRK